MEAVIVVVLLLAAWGLLAYGEQASFRGRVDDVRLPPRRERAEDRWAHEEAEAERRRRLLDS